MTDALPALPELLDLDWGAFDDDLAFYANLAARGDGPVLELGVGTGRIALALAQDGFEVWGIDVSAPMLERARCKAGPGLAERVRLSEADMRDFDLDRNFDLIFAGYGGFHHLLTRDDQLACLRTVRRHLAPDGLFVCDLRALHAADWEIGDSVPLLHDWTRTLPSSGQTVTKLRAVRPDPTTQVQHEQHMYDVADADGGIRRVMHGVDLRFTTRYEMESLLRDAGLELDRTYGDYDLGPYNEASEVLITIARIASKEQS